MLKVSVMVLALSLAGSIARACEDYEAMELGQDATRADLAKIGVKSVRFNGVGCSSDKTCRGEFTFKKDNGVETQDFAGGFTIDSKKCEVMEIGWGTLGEEVPTSKP